MYGVRELECVCRGCETDTGRGPAARPFVQDVQSAARLPVSRSRRSRDLYLSGSRATLWASRTNGLLPVDGRRRSLSRANHTREVSYAIQCIRRRGVVVTPTPAPFAFLSAGYHLQAG